MDDRFKKQMEFALEIDKEKNILRRTHLSNNGRAENDAEHAWHMAIMAYLLKEYSNEEIDISKAMIMCLIHDLVEIYAGDTYAYDEVNKMTQHEREEEAKKKLFEILPKDQAEEFTKLFDEFESCETAEAKFVRAMDNVQPLMLNNSNGGADWKNNNVKRTQVENRQKTTYMGSDFLGDYVMEIIEKHVSQGSIRPE